MSLSLGAKATLGLWVAALVWDAICPSGQTISEAVERGLNNKTTEPFVTAAILITVAHLLRMSNDKYDVYSIVFHGIERVVRRSYERA